MSRLLRPSLVATAALISLVACEQDPGGPALVPTGAVHIVPTFLNAEAAARIPIAQVVLRIRTPGGRLVMDSTIAYPTGADSLVLNLDVPLSTGATLGASETFALTLAMLGPAGDTIFRGGPFPVVAQSGTATTPPPAVRIPIRYVGTGAGAASVRLIGRDTVLSFGDSMLVQAEVLDSAGAVIPGTPLVFVSPDSATILRIPNDEVGRVYARTTRGAGRLVVRTLTGQNAVRIILVQPVPSKIEKVSGDSQTVVVNEPSAPLQVKVSAADNLGVAGVPVVFSMISGGGTVGDSLCGAGSTTCTSYTDTAGIARLRWRPGTTVGPNTIRAQLTGATGSPITFSMTGRHGVPVKTVFRTHPSTVVAGAPMSPAVVAEVQDTHGNLATTYADTVRLQITTNPVGSGITGTTLVIASGGVATFPGVRLNRAGVGYRLSAFARGTPIQTPSNPFNVTAATPAFIIKRSGDLQIGSPGTALTDSVSVQVKDSLGNHLPAVMVTWTVVTGGGTVSTSSTTTNDDGVAKVRWTLGGAIGVHNVDASVTGLAAVRFGAVAAPPGTTRVWTGKTSADWNTAGNWHPAGVPVVTDTLFIPGGLVAPALSAAGAAGSIVAGAGSTINLGAFSLTAGAKVDVHTVAGTGEVVLAGTSRTVVGTFPNLRVTGTYSLAGHTTVSGNVIVSSTGRLKLAGRRLFVGGRFETMESGTLEMIDPADSLITEGEMKFGGGVHTGLLTNGFMQLKGAFTQTGTGATFLATGAHRTKFAGAASQTATFADGRASKFHELELSNPAGLAFAGRASIGGRMNILGGAGNVTGTDTVGVGGDLLDGTGGRWQIGITKFEGVTNSLPISTTTKAVVTGTLAPASGGTITGDVDIRGSGVLRIPGAAIVQVTGSLSTTETGALRMDAAGGQLNVTGNATFSGGSTTGLLTNGTLRVAGNFTQTTTRATFDASGEHKTIFNGTLPQTVTFPDVDATVSGIFNDVQFDNPAGTTMAGFAYTARDATVGGGAGVVSGGTGFSVGRNLSSTTAQWQPPFTRLTGANPITPAKLDKDVEVANLFTLPANFEVGGNLSIVAGGNVTVNGRMLKVGGLSTHETGTLTMAAGDSVDSAGDVYFAGGASSLTGGALVARADFRALGTADGAGSATAFAATGTHRTVLMGPTLIMTGSGAAGNRFSKVQVARAGTVSQASVPTSLLYATDSLIVSTGATLGTGTGATERVVANGPVLINGTAQPRAMELGSSLAVVGGTFIPDTTVFIGPGRTVPSRTYNSVRVSTTSDELYFSCGGTVNGKLRVVGGAAKLETGCAAVTVNGDLETADGGALVMTDGNDFVINGNVLFAGGTPELTAGTLRVTGNFTQTGPATSFVASGTHRTSFEGSSPHIVTFASPGLAASRFARLDASGPATGVSLMSDVFADELHVSTTSLSGTGRTVTITARDAVVNSGASLSLAGGRLVLPRRLFGSGTVTVDTVSFEGTPRNLSHGLTWGAGTVVKLASIALDTINSTETFPRLVLSGTSSGLVVNGIGNLNVNDALVVKDGATFNLTAGRTASVTKNATFNGVNPTGTGTLAADSVVYTGLARAVAFNTYGAGTDVRISTTGGSTMMPAGTTLPASLRISGAGASYSVGGGTIGISGNLVTDDGGVLSMSSAADVLNLTGSATFDGGSSALSAGTLNITGNFSQLATSTTSSFVASGTHTTNFVGGGVPHTISFASSSDVASRFQNLGVQSTTAATTLNSDVHVNGAYTQSAGGVLQRGGATTGKLTAMGAVSIAAGTFNPYMLSAGSTVTTSTPLTVDTLVYLGAGRVMPTPALGGSTSIRVSTGGDLTLNVALSARSLIISGPGAGVSLGAAANVVLADQLRTASDGVLKMPTAGAQVTVNGDATFAGGSTLGLLTNGTITFRGNVTQAAGGAAAAYAPTTNHVSVLHPNAANRTVSFANLDTTTASHFHHLKISNVGGGAISTQLLTDVAATGQLLTDLNSAGSQLRVINGGGFNFGIAGADADSVRFDNAKVVIAGNRAVTRFENHQWFNMPATVPQLTVARAGDGTNYTGIKNLVMDGPNHAKPDPDGVTGFYIRALRASGAGTFTVTLSGMTPFSPSGRNQTVAATITGWP